MADYVMSLLCTIGFCTFMCLFALLLAPTVKKADENNDHSFRAKVLTVICCFFMICACVVWIIPDIASRQTEKNCQREHWKLKDKIYELQKKLAATDQEVSDAFSRGEEYGRRLGYKEGYNACLRDSAASEIPINADSK